MENNNNEVWKDVLGYEGLYRVSSKGQISSKDRHITMKNGISCFKKGVVPKSFKTPFGYYRIELNSYGINRKFFVHRLVLLSFVPNINNLPEVNHINGIKTDNSIENLEWVSKRDNMLHAIDKGLKIIAKGYNHPSTKLDKEQMEKARACLSINTNKSKSELAKDFGISSNTLWRIEKKLGFRK